VGLNEADTRSKLIDPALHACGWTEDLIRREVDVRLLGASGRSRVDYVLSLSLSSDSKPVPVAIIEAKPEDASPDEGLEQAKQAAFSPTLNVPFVFSTNGHHFVEFNRFTGHTSPPHPLSDFSTPEQLFQRCTTTLGLGAGTTLQPSGAVGAKTEEERAMAQEFAAETKEAQHLVAEKPPGWPWLLTAELLEQRLAPLQTWKEEDELYEVGSYWGGYSSPHGFLHVKEDRVKSGVAEANRLIKEINRLLRHNLVQVWRHGDPLYIKQMADMIAEAVCALAEIESRLLALLKAEHTYVRKRTGRGARVKCQAGGRTPREGPAFKTFQKIIKHLRDLETEREWKIIVDQFSVQPYRIRIEK